MTKSVLNEKQKAGNELKGEKLITRIKLTNDDKLEIDYKLSNDDEALTVKYYGKDSVTQKFLEKFEETNSIIDEILPDIQNIDKVHIIRLEYTENGFLEKISLSFQVKCELSNCPINIATPYIGFIDPENEEVQLQALSNDAEQITHEIIALTKAYMNGDTRTKQLSLVVNNEDCD